MGNFLSSLRNGAPSAPPTSRQRARSAPLAQRTRAMWIDRQVTTDVTGAVRSQPVAARSRSVPDAGTPLGERRVRQESSPGFSTFRPPDPVQSGEGQSAEQNTEQVPGAPVAGVPATGQDTRTTTPPAAACGLEGVPEPDGGVAGLSAEELAEWRALVRETGETVDRGYAKDVFTDGHPECRHPLSSSVFPADRQSVQRGDARPACAVSGSGEFGATGSLARGCQLREGRPCGRVQSPHCGALLRESSRLRRADADVSTVQGAQGTGLQGCPHPRVWTSPVLETSYATIGVAAEAGCDAQGKGRARRAARS